MPAPISIAIRGVSADTLAQFRRGAAMRGSSQAQYLAALVELHARMRALAFADPVKMAQHADVDMVTVCVKVPDHHTPVMAAIDAAFASNDDPIVGVPATRPRCATPVSGHTSRLAPDSLTSASTARPSPVGNPLAKGASGIASRVQPRDCRAWRSTRSASKAPSAMEAMGLKPLLVSGSAQNFKVTYPEDFALAEAILRKNTR